MNKSLTFDYWNNAYANNDANAQRKYPNEEFCRFFGRNFSMYDHEDLNEKSFMELGCGNGSNLIVPASAGFKCHGIDISPDAVELCKDKFYGLNSNVDVQAHDINKFKFGSDAYDVVADIFSCYCLNKEQWTKLLVNIHRGLKAKGLLFIYTPTKNSTSYLKPGLESLIDADTLTGVSRNNAPFSGNNYPFRFADLDELCLQLKETGFHIQYCETIKRTYSQQTEYFEWACIEAKKI